MINQQYIPKKLIPLLKEKLHGREDEIIFPPPVFITMEGKVIDYDGEQELLVNRFPVLSQYLNPYGSLQGGIISAAIDNTIGPLSMIVSPPNFTRYLDLKYAKAIYPELGYFYVKARFVGSKKRQLYFEAVVEDEDGTVYASAKATHWVI